ncbi:MAG: leucyl aminopeptidase [Proteobacteria bacterium]|nr:MAG: leucyl aminopeptidase [Pseudomonadota bacterium]
MNYDFQAAANAESVKADCVVVGVFKGGQLSAAATQINAASQGALQQHLDMGDFNGKKGRTSLLYHLPNISAQRVLLVGLGERDKLTEEGMMQANTHAANALKNTKVKKVASFLSDEAASEHARAAVRQAVMAVAGSLYRFEKYRSKQDHQDKPSLESWLIAHTTSEDFSEELTQGNAIAQGMQLARDLGNMPGNACTPSYLAELASELAGESTAISVEVLNESNMEDLGMGAFLSVCKGSHQEGKMIILNYRGTDAAIAPIVLVGKGITFDAGGISLKPGLAMDEMKYDMSGAGSVLGTLKACALMNLPLNVIGVIAAAENMPDAVASKPGDIVTSLSGKTIEILNTDAEGRLVLCDALTYVERFKPAAVIDIATLTGACITALGHHTSGLLSNNDELANSVLTASQEALDEAWRLPMNDKYQEQLKSNFADMANIGGPAGGTITAACFLSRFTESYPWVHLDVAGTAWKSGAAKGSTGRPVPLLTQILLNRSERA